MFLVKSCFRPQFYILVLGMFFFYLLIYFPYPTQIFISLFYLDFYFPFPVWTFIFPFLFGILFSPSLFRFFSLFYLYFIFNYFSNSFQFFSIEACVHFFPFLVYLFISLFIHLRSDFGFLPKFFSKSYIKTMTHCYVLKHFIQNTIQEYLCKRITNTTIPYTTGSWYKF